MFTSGSHLKDQGSLWDICRFLHQSVQFLSGNYSLAYRISNYLFPDQLSPIGAWKTNSVLFGSGQQPHEERTRFYFDVDIIRDESGQNKHEIRTKLAWNPDYKHRFCKRIIYFGETMNCFQIITINSPLSILGILWLMRIKINWFEKIHPNKQHRRNAPEWNMA